MIDFTVDEMQIMVSAVANDIKHLKAQKGIEGTEMERQALIGSNLLVRLREELKRKELE